MTGKEFKTSIAALGLSQAKFAKRVGVQASTVSDWVNGPAKVPGYATYILKLLNAIEELKEATK